MPGVVAKLSGKLNFYPIPMAGHILCRRKTTMSSSKSSCRHTPCKPPSQPSLRAPSTPRQRGSSSKQTQNPHPHYSQPRESTLPKKSWSPRPLAQGAKHSKNPNRSSNLQRKENQIREQQRKTQPPIVLQTTLTTSLRCSSPAAQTPSLQDTTSLVFGCPGMVI